MVEEFAPFLLAQHYLGTPRSVFVSLPPQQVIFTSEALELLFSTICSLGLEAASLLFGLKILTWTGPRRNPRKLFFEIFLGLALTGMKVAPMIFLLLIQTSLFSITVNSTFSSFEFSIRQKNGDVKELPLIFIELLCLTFCCCSKRICCYGASICCW